MITNKKDDKENMTNDNYNLYLSILKTLEAKEKEKHDTNIVRLIKEGKEDFKKLFGEYPE